MAKILVVDDDPSFNKMLITFLIRNSFETTAAHSSQSALRALDNNSFDLVLTDYKLPDFNGLELIEKIKKKEPNLPVILMTTYSDVRTAVKSIQLGAYEFLTKPVNPDELLLLVQRVLSMDKKQEVSKENKASANEYIAGDNESGRELIQHIELVAPTKMSVLILGESGTGKEYAARMIHQKSKRKSNVFFAVDCGALSKELAPSELFGHIKGAFTGASQNKKGAFELANGGTLFLDEIGNLSYEVQVQLLRALQERKIRKVGDDTDISVDVRILAATNEALMDTSETTDFRLDLYHRINEFTLKIPPLRKRIEDFEKFVDHFLHLSSNELNKDAPAISSDVMQIFKNYHWPGNLRELRNIIRRCVLLSTGDKITLSHLPEEIKNSIQDGNEKTAGTNRENINKEDLKALQKETEKEAIIRVLKAAKYNKSKAAETLNIDRKTLYRKLKKYDIDH
ncbi:sigma-54-dependent transcriptional regulator [Ekhidna sp.]